MGIKRLAKKTSEPSIPKTIGEVEICKEVAVTSTPAVSSIPGVSSTPGVAGSLDDLSIVPSTAAVMSTPVVSSAPPVSGAPPLDALVSVGSLCRAVSGVAEPGKRLRRKMPSCISPEKPARLDDPMGGSPGALRRSIASPARQRSFGQALPESASEGNEQMLDIVAVGEVYRKARSPSVSSSDSSSRSSRSSSSSSSGSSSCGEAPVRDLRSMYKEGQRFPTPPVAEATRGFFVTLYEENPESRVATKWLVEQGVFPQAKHNQLLKKYILHKELMRQAQAKALSASPSKVRKAFPKRPNQATTVKHHMRPQRAAFKKR